MNNIRRTTVLIMAIAAIWALAVISVWTTAAGQALGGLVIAMAIILIWSATEYLGI